MPAVMIVFILSAIVASAQETGYASWYGGKFQGRKTANGEIFDTNQLTAAHRTLPFGTLVKVTNMGNGLSVTVRINDRGPFVEGRIIDLSRAAADAIGMMGSGVAYVSVEVVSSPAPADALFTVQAGAFSRKENAEAMAARLQDAGLSFMVAAGQDAIYRVVLSDVPEPELQKLLGRLKAEGIGKPLVRKQ
jgi:rare lipoprotein A